jgi:hypothetical protein
MQKLSGTSSGKNNKSCGIFHNEVNKIDFAFLWCFYNLLRHLQESAKALYYWSFSFADRPLKWFRSLQIHPYFADWPSETLESLQCGPPALAGGGPAKIRRSPAAGSAGDGRGAVLGLLGTGFDQSPGRWGSWRSRTKTAAAASRGMPGSGETEVNAGQPVVVVALVNARGGVGTVAWPRELAGTRLDGGSHGGRRSHVQLSSGGPL